MCTVFIGVWIKNDFPTPRFFCSSSGLLVESVAVKMSFLLWWTISLRTLRAVVVYRRSLGGPWPTRGVRKFAFLKRPMRGGRKRRSVDKRRLSWALPRGRPPWHFYDITFCYSICCLCEEREYELFYISVQFLFHSCSFCVGNWVASDCSYWSFKETLILVCWHLYADVFLEVYERFEHSCL